MKAHDGMYIDGEWRPAAGTDTIEVVNPADEQVIGHVPAGHRRGRGRRRTGRARRPARPGPPPRPPSAPRGSPRCATSSSARKDEIAETVTAELGSPLKFSQAVHVGAPIAVAGSYAELAASYAFEEKVGNSTVLLEPVGVVGAITPWNYPLHQIVAKVAPALAAGCTVVLKPAEDTPLVAQLFAEAVHEAGLPAGVFNLVTGLGPVAGQALAEHEGVDLVSFTGSTAVGRQIGATAGAAVKRVALELGGKSANVILPSADLAKAVNVGVANVMSNSGQTCSAWTRMLVHGTAVRRGRRAGRRRPPRSTASASGPSSTPSSGSGCAVTSRRASRRGRGWSRAAPKPRANRATSSARPSSPTSTPDMTIAQEEIFGPVLSILRYEDEEDALRIANGTVYGLAGAVWAGDDDGGRRLRPPPRHRAGRHQRRTLQPPCPLRRLQAVGGRPRAGRARPGRVPPDQVPAVLVQEGCTTWLVRRTRFAPPSCPPSALRWRSPRSSCRSPGPGRSGSGSPPPASATPTCPCPTAPCGCRSPPSSATRARAPSSPSDKGSRTSRPGTGWSSTGRPPAAVATPARSARSGCAPTRSRARARCTRGAPPTAPSSTPG